MALKQSFKVRDFRNKGFFMVDDAYLNGYAKKLGSATSMVYFALCRAVDKEQTAFPSQEYIGDKIGIHRVTVARCIKKLIDWNIVRVEQIRNHSGKFLHNTYYLLDKSEWKENRVTQELRGDSRVAFDDKTVYRPRYNKETHKKDTHILKKEINKERKITWSKIEELQEQDFQEIAEMQQVPISLVMSKFEDMRLWKDSQPHSKKMQGRNWKVTLIQFVKNEKFKWLEKTRKEAMFNGNNKLGIDATKVPGIRR